MKYIINETNKINDKVIDDKIFQTIGYTIKETDDLINDLIGWISEATTDKEIMKDDLKYLMSISDKYILSSMSTNEYLTENTEEGQKVLAEIYNTKN